MKSFSRVAVLLLVVAVLFMASGCASTPVFEFPASTFPADFSWGR